MRNIDLPPSFYNVNKEVSFTMDHSLSSFTVVSLPLLAPVFEDMNRLLQCVTTKVLMSFMSCIVCCGDVYILENAALLLIARQSTCLSRPFAILAMEPFYLRNISRGGSDYDQFQLPTDFKKRPGFNTTGKPIQVAINSYPVTQFPNIKVFQYDVRVLLLASFAAGC
jgi:hypothetical protein